MGRTACAEDQCLYKGALYLTVKLYLYSPYGPYGLCRAPVPVQGCTLPYSRAIPLLPLWAVRPVQSLSACTRVHFTFLPFMGSHNLCTHGMYFPVVNIGLKMVLNKPKHAAKELMYWCCVKKEETILLGWDRAMVHLVPVTAEGRVRCQAIWRMTWGEERGNGKAFSSNASVLSVSMLSHEWSLLMLYAFFSVIPRRLNFICRRFGTLCSIFIGR